MQYPKISEHCVVSFHFGLCIQDTHTHTYTESEINSHVRYLQFGTINRDAIFFLFSCDLCAFKNCNEKEASNEMRQMVSERILCVVKLS